MDDSQMTRERTRLYLITPPHVEWPAFADSVKQAFDGGDVACLQIRLKDRDYVALPEAEQIEAIEMLKPLCAEYGVALILNDLPELAKRYDLDGVHVGADDMSVADARTIVGEDKIVGASCYASLDLAYAAAEQGANYVAFGQFYPTKTKPPKGHPDLDLLTFWQECTELPCVAIGGLKVDNSAPIVKAGADFLAVVTGVWDYEAGSAQAVVDFNALINSQFS